MIAKGSSIFRLNVLLVVTSVIFPTNKYTSTISALKIKCIEKEREALLNQKREFKDYNGRFSSWRADDEHKDCCLWQGVGCDNVTGHIIKLDIGGGHDCFSAPVSGRINNSLLKLRHLKYLDLSCNGFIYQLPEFIGSFTKLKYLNLSNNFFDGVIPTHLANLTELETLDLSGRENTLHSRNLGWLCQLHKLRYLDLTNVNLTMATDWLELVHQLPLIEKVSMSECSLPEVANILRSSLINSSRACLSTLGLSGNSLSSSSIYPWLFNFSNNLRDIDLSYNNLQQPFPDDFGNIISLEHLDLSYNSNIFQGGIPKSLGKLTGLKSLLLSCTFLIGELQSQMHLFSWRTKNSLEYLDLSLNRFTGSLPDISGFTSLISLEVRDNQLNGFFHGASVLLPSLLVLDASNNQLTGTLPDFSFFPSLRELYLDHNIFNGTITQSIGRLLQLEELYLSSNALEGIITEAHLLNLSRLRVMDLSFNSHLKFELSDTKWIPPFQLDVIALSQVKMGSPFPKWLQTQHHFYILDMSCAEISDIIPTWFWDVSPRLNVLNLSSNHIYGALPNLTSKFGTAPVIDLSSNDLSGQLPYFSPTTHVLDLSKNKFKGSINFLCNTTRRSTYLDLSDNLLSGVLDPCLQGVVSYLDVLNLANNKFSGNISTAIFGEICFLESLQLQNNMFTGEIPTSLLNCKYLKILNLGVNKLSGKLPDWITGVNFPNLMLLSLRSNEFHGTLPSDLCFMSSIQILDLSLNKIYGPIPKCLQYLTALTQEGSQETAIYLDMFYDSYVGNSFCEYPQCSSLQLFSVSAVIIWKGIESKYRNTLRLVKVIDLSSNFLEGEVPAEITNLRGLLGLNLSRNNLTGTIPPKLDQLRSLNFLDLSHNCLSGSIPSTISELSHLGVLNLSYNNLSGRIPPKPHLQTFDNSSYIGNSQLCGIPLTLLCLGDKAAQAPKIRHNDGDRMTNHEALDEFLSMGFYICMALGFIFGFWGVIGTLVLNTTCRHFLFSQNYWEWEDGIV